MNKQTAWFRFYGVLNDFISKHQKDQWIEYSYNGTPAVKDAIEAIGIPHVEVKAILMEGMPVAFSHHIHPQSKFEIYPFISEDIIAEEQQFVLDVHLGSLARTLRLLGFDTYYQKDFHDNDIAAVAAAEKRIVLTRDIGLLKHKLIKRGYWLRSQITIEQTLEVVQRFCLLQSIKPFSRCMACNGIIQPVDKSLVVHQIPNCTKEYFHHFYKCTNCNKVYWKGSHYQKMQGFVQDLRNRLKEVPV